MVRLTSSLRTMLLELLSYQFATLLLTWAENACIVHPTFREPANSDIQVFCGSETVELEILLCPIYFLGYNESTLALNSQYSNDQCKGRPDWKVDPPVVRFSFSITEQAIAACSSKLTVIEEAGTGAFTDFSTVQFISISGTVSSHDLSSGLVTYQEDMMYKFSCRYPLQYLVNNTEISVTDVSLAVRDNNGSFISALSMRLYSDRHYSSMLQIPPGGMELKTRIYVEVKASNLTNRFSVLLDRCYATPSPFPLNITCHDLFVGCNRDCQTIIGVNGKTQEARFSFETFRFLQNQNSPISTYYIHCATRLCVNSICPDLVQSCNASTALRRRRSVDNTQATAVSDTATVSSGPITTRLDNDNLVISEGAQQAHMNSTMLVVSLVAGILSVVCLSMLAFIVYHMSKSNINIIKTMHYPKE